MSIIESLMKTELVTVKADETVAHAAWSMARNGVGAVLVLEGGSLMGVLSERDLLRASLSSLAHRVDERRAFLDGIDISRVMSAPPITVGPNDSVTEAAGIMADEKIGCLPVLDGEELIGLLTETDLLRYFADQARERG